MKIKIDHIAKTEGHSGFMGNLVRGNMEEVRMDIKEGARLIEGILVGRHFSDAPIITSRICGVCPTVHNITSIRAMEKALGIEVNDDIKLLRKIMLCGEVIDSHILHMYFLSLGDFFGIKNDLDLIAKYKKQAGEVIDIRKFSGAIVETIAGRSIHPISATIGGFHKKPEKEKLKKLLKDSERVLEQAVSIAKFFSDLTYPEFQRKTDYVCLMQGREYPFYFGKLHSGDESGKEEAEFYKSILEYHEPYDVIKRVKRNGKSIMVGAIARINNNYKHLNPRAKELLYEAKIPLPTFNSFHNVLCQTIEVVHTIEEVQKLLKEALEKKFGKVKQEFKVKAGEGVAACEAPRGTLYHYYKIDDRGYIKEANIITPTAQHIGNLEEDLKKYIPKIKEANREDRIKMFIRAYDPCISCATH